jgi:predicted DsbA family dithiol-disulfide isomerase
MQVEIWSDIICPWCGLGQHRLELALAGFAHRDAVTVAHRSFQLDPRAPATPRPVREMLRERGYDEAAMAASWARIEAQAARDGLSPYLLDNLVANTGPAHELLALASERGLEAAAWRRMYRAYFGERLSIFGVDALVERGLEIGLDPGEIREALADRRYRARVEREAREAGALGAGGVPFVVIDRRIAIAGAQPLEIFRQALERGWEAAAAASA